MSPNSTAPSVLAWPLGLRISSSSARLRMPSGSELPIDEESSMITDTLLAGVQAELLDFGSDVRPDFGGDCSLSTRGTAAALTETAAAQVRVARAAERIAVLAAQTEARTPICAPVAWARRVLHVQLLWNRFRIGPRRLTLPPVTSPHRRRTHGCPSGSRRGRASRPCVAGGSGSRCTDTGPGWPRSYRPNG